MIVTALVFGWALKVALIAIAILYGGLVLANYATGGARYPLRLDPEEPARSLQQILVWAGVKLLDAMVRTLKVLWEMLSDASAEVGEWFVSRRSPRVQAEFRSHFL